MAKVDEKKIQNLREDGKEAADTLNEKVAKAGREARTFFLNVRDRATEERDNMRNRIKLRPLTSTAVAFGAGVVIAALLRRR